jgi:hypothetical protein
METKNIRKALEEKAVALSTIVHDFEWNNEIVFASGYVAHKNDRLLLIDYVLDILDNYVVVPRKQLSELLKNVPSHVKYQDCPPCSAWMDWSAKVKEWFEAQK